MVYSLENMTKVLSIYHRSLKNTLGLLKIYFCIKKAQVIVVLGKTNFLDVLLADRVLIRPITNHMIGQKQPLIGKKLFVRSS